MVNRIILKERAKTAVRRNYWMCVLVALIALVVLGSSVTSRRTATINPQQQVYTYTDTGFSQELHQTLRGQSSAIFASGGLIAALIHLFIFRILEIGCDKFFINNAVGKAVVSDDVLCGFRESYGRNVLTMFLIDLYLVFWYLLFIIPGVIKTYSYRLVPYILADSPDISRSEAFLLSRQLMNGNKMNAFILDLSFIGWEILNVLTFGILGVFYVNPYVHATNAELYLTLRYGK